MKYLKKSLILIMVLIVLVYATVYLWNVVYNKSFTFDNLLGVQMDKEEVDYNFRKTENKIPDDVMQATKKESQETRDKQCREETVCADCAPGSGVDCSVPVCDTRTICE